MTTALPSTDYDRTSGSGSSDAELLQSWSRQQCSADFTELVRRYHGLVRGIASRQLGEDHADDTAQSVFAILARKATELGDLQSLGGWLHRVTMLECRNVVRRLQRERRSVLAAMDNALLSSARDPFDEALPHLDAAINALGESDRELIFLRYSEGVSFSQASARTGRGEAALRQQAARAVEKLSQHLRRQGVVVPGAALTAGMGAALGTPGNAEAAVACARAALAASSKICGATLAALSLAFMTTNQSIIAGALAALLLSAGPVFWQMHQIQEASSQRSDSLARPVGSPAPPPVESDAAPVLTEAAVAAGPAAKGMNKDNVLTALGEILEAEFVRTISEWAHSTAWLESRRMARLLSLSSSQEQELRNFIQAGLQARVAHSHITDDGDARNDRKDFENSLDAWCAVHLTPEQNSQRTVIKKRQQEAQVENLAEASLHSISMSVMLNPEQKSALYQAAAAKVAAQLESGDYGGQMSFGATIAPNTGPTMEDSSGDLLAAVLQPDQMELWEQSHAQDEIFTNELPRRLADRALVTIRDRGLGPLVASAIQSFFAE